MAISWERFGSCHHCGDCCRAPNGIRAPTDEQQEDYENSGRNGGYCYYADLRPDGVFCGLHGTRFKPNGCVRFPFDPTHLQERCGYRLIQVRINEKE